MTSSPNRDDQIVSGTILIFVVASIIVAWIAVIASVTATPLDSPSITPQQGATYLGAITTIGITLVGTLWARGPHPHPVTDAQLHLVSVTLVGLALLAGIVGVAVLVDQAPEALSLDQLVVFGASVLFVLVTSIGGATIPTRVSVDYRDRAEDRRRAGIKNAIDELAKTQATRAAILADLSLPWIVPGVVIATAVATSRQTQDVAVRGALVGVVFLVLTLLVLTLLAQFITNAWMWMLLTSAALLLVLGTALVSVTYLPAGVPPLILVFGSVVSFAAWITLMTRGFRSGGGLRPALLFVVQRISRTTTSASSRRPSTWWQAFLRLTGRVSDPRE